MVWFVELILRVRMHGVFACAYLTSVRAKCSVHFKKVKWRDLQTWMDIIHQSNTRMNIFFEEKHRDRTHMILLTKEMYLFYLGIDNVLI